MTRVYKTVGSEGGTKQHVIHEIDEETGKIDILCDIGVDPDNGSEELWRTKQRMYKADSVCENCKKEIFDAVPHIQKFDEKIEDGEEELEDEGTSSNQGIISKILSAVPWV